MINFKSQCGLWIEKHWLKAISLAIFILIIADRRGDAEFLLHILAEVAGICLGIFLALVIVDEYNDRHWKRNRSLIINSLIYNLNEISLKLCTKLPPILIRNKNLLKLLSSNKRKINPKTLQAIKDILKTISDPEMEKWQRSIGTGNDKSVRRISDYIIEFHEDIGQNLYFLDFILTPGLIRDLDEEVMEALINLEEAKGELQKCVTDYKRGTTSSILPSLILFIERIQNLYGILLKRYYIYPMYIRNIWQMP